MPRDGGIDGVEKHVIRIERRLDDGRGNRPSRRGHRLRERSAIGAAPVVSGYHVQQLAGEQADEKAGGCRGADPPAAGAGAETCGGQRTGEGQDLRTVTGLLETGQDSLPLRLECAVIEMGVGIGSRRRSISVKDVATPCS
jgi:hypothetical protein